MTDLIVELQHKYVLFIAQVGDRFLDDNEWTRPENMTTDRPSYLVNDSAPGSDLTGETAAALAAGSMAFRDTDSAYADTLLDHARQLFTFADTYQGLYKDVIPTGGRYRLPLL